MKKLFVIMFVVILLAGSVSAFEFDNVGNYNEETKTMTIKNAFGLGEDLVDAKLNSENHEVIKLLGYVKIAEVEVVGKTDYGTFFNEMRSYNVKDNLEELNINFDFKIRVNESYEFSLWNQECDTCERTLDRKEIRYRDVLENTTLEDLEVKKDEKIIIEIWTNVKDGDYIEWIPNIAGVNINQWASYEGSGGSVTTDGEYTIHTYTSSGTFNWTGATTEIEVLVVAGGGSGASEESAYNGGAGGAGGITNDSAFSISEGFYNITVGSGATAPSGNTWGTNGTNSSFDASSNFNTFGGGGGGYRQSGACKNGLAGGSGGGTAGCSGGSTGGIGVVGQGKNGGSSGGGANGAAGGGGANEVGENAETPGGDGGDGLGFSIFNGTELFYGGGGGGAGNSAHGTGGKGGGGRGAKESEGLALNGNVSTGGGGGGGNQGKGGNGGSGIVIIRYLTSVTISTINLDSPVNNTNFTLTNNVVMNATIFDATNITNVTLYLNNVGNETNSTSGINNTVWTFTKNVGEGDTFWTLEACNFLNVCGNASEGQRMFNVNTIPNIQYGAGVPVNEFNSTDNFFEVNATLTENLFNNITFDLYNVNGALNRSVTFTNSSRAKNWTNLIDSTYSYNVTVATTTNQFNSTGTRNISVDGTKPALNVFFPNETIAFHKINTPLFVNWSVNDTNLDACILEFQGVNTTETCINNQTTIDINNSVNRSLTFYANDTFGNINVTSVSWNYRLFQEKEEFVAAVLEGASSVFSINFTTNGSDITIGNLSYNLSGNIGTIVSVGNSFEINRTIIAPAVNSESKESFFWEITQAGTFTFSTDAQNQTVTDFGIDSCLVNTEVLYNFTIVDERTQAKLVEATQNTTGDLNLQIFNFGTNNVVANFSNAYTSNGFSVCLNDSLSGGEEYGIDVEVQYSADDYASEFFHIQNDTLNNADFFTNITLYDLDDTTSEEFSISFKNQNFLAVGDALIQIQRKYISEGIFRTVEIPKTDSEGETIAHLEVQEVVYTFVVVKFGEVLGTFNDVRVDCNPLLQICKINLNALSSHIETGDFANLEDFSYTLTYDRLLRTIESIFVIPSNTVASVSLNATLLDGLGTTQVCDKRAVSSGGTLTCVVPSSFGNASVFVKLSKNEVLQGSGTISLKKDPSEIFGANLVFLTLFLYLTLIGLGISDSPMVMGVFLIFGAILGIALNLIDATGFIGKGATVLWFFIAVFVVLIKGAKRN